jgi:GNAT superfamily N-acetyltransferase
MIIRTARREDIPAIVAIYSLDSLTGHRESITTPLSSFYFEAFEAIGRDPHQTLLVAEQDSQIVGTLQITIIQHVISQALRRAVLEAFFVHPLHQGTGAGRTLLQAAIDRASAAHCTSLELTSNKTRPKAHRFYEQAGFTPTHEGFKMTLHTPKPS